MIYLARFSVDFVSKATILDKAEAAIKKFVVQHKKDGRPLVVWENGKVKKIAVK